MLAELSISNAMAFFAELFAALVDFAIHGIECGNVDFLLPFLPYIHMLAELSISNAMAFFAELFAAFIASAILVME
jgi:hypothetical protein